MRHPRARVLASVIALLGVLALPVAGCGTDQKNEYEKNVQKAADEFKAAVQKAGARVQKGAVLQQRVAGLATFKAAVDKLAGELDKLDPPGELKQANDDAVKQLHTLSADVGDYEAAARDGDTAQAQKIVPKLQADQAVLQKTLDRIDQRTGG